VVEIVAMLKITFFYSSGGWESDGPRRLAGDGGANSILQFQLEIGDDGMKHYLKIKQRQRAHFSSMGRKHDTVA
jgi:hypothetical protein